MGITVSVAVNVKIKKKKVKSEKTIMFGIMQNIVAKMVNM